MASWGSFANAQPELAEFGAARFAASGIAYLATTTKDGSPRVHPVTPIVAGDRLFVFMEPTSPKGHDLRRDGRFALHSSVGGPNGDEGEFLARGVGTPVQDPSLRRLAVEAASYSPDDRYVLFELGVDRVTSTVYEGGKPVRRRWRAGASRSA